MTRAEERSTALVPASPDDIAITSGEIPEDPLIGQTLHDTYNVVKALAEGGMGRVYEAHHTRIQSKRFAIKVLHGELKHSMDVRMRFRREAEAAAVIEHPNVIGVHDFGYTPDGRPYLVSDLLEGRELHALLENHTPLSVKFACSIAVQICHALEAAHDKGVIHRDLKPANVFLTGPIDAPDVKVLDFGLSKVLEIADATDTQTGTVMGTPSYMSPEQAKGEKADHRADIYGVGAVLYACLTGRPPYEEDSPHQTVLAVMTREPVRPCVLVPSIPPELEVIVQKAMAHKPSERYGSMREFEAELKPFAENIAARRASAPKAQTIEARDLDPSNPAMEARGVRRRATAWLMLAASLLVVGGLSGAVGAFPLVTESQTLSGTELLLVSLALVGSLFTPALLFVLWLRRRYWNNSARMIELVGSVRAPVIAAAAAYGLAALLGRVLDAGSLYVHVGRAPNASGWPGWAPFLFALGLLAALATMLRSWILGASRSFFRRVVAGPVLLTLAGAGVCALLVTGYRYSAASEIGSPQAAITKPNDTDKSAPTATALPTVTEHPAAAPSAPTAPPIEPKLPDAPQDRAPDDALAAAQAAGVQQLSDLQTKYPKDPRVAKALALALGKEPDRASELLRVLDNLFVIAPEQANDPQLSNLVWNAALAPTTSQRAIELMRTQMGTHGPELLFDLVMGEPAARSRAKAALESAEAQRNLTPALKIAYDLFTAPTCSLRSELLPQAIRDGDERAIKVLQLSTAKVMTCGPKRNKACPPPCEKEVPAFEAAIKQIDDRLAAKKANANPG